MMITAASQLLDEYRKKNVRLSVDGGKLIIDAPKGALGSEDLSRLRENRSAIIELIERARSDASVDRIEPRGHDGACPLSYAQQRLWFVDQLNPEGSRAYHISTMLKVEGELDVLALRRALDRIVSRHEALRTVFVCEGEQAVQMIVPQTSFSLVERDFSALEMPERTRELEREIQEEPQRRFDLGSGPLMRGLLLRQGPQEHVLLLSMHHIVSDGWSLSVLMKELSTLYAAYSQGGDEPLSDLPVQYADYTLWQRQRLQG